jgi:hypothetical protein
MRRLAGAVLLLMVAAGCASEPDHEMADWRMVLIRKRVLLRSDQAAREPARQSYTDALRTFCRRYPAHTRAREVYSDMELVYARELFARGDYEQAARFYESVLRDHPDRAPVRKEHAEALRRRFINRQSMAMLKRGMTPEQVTAKIGVPLPGWQKTLQKGDRNIHSWFYRRSDGGTAGVYFMDGRLFAADYDGAIPLEPSR